MQPHTIRRTAVAFLAAAFLAGMFAVAQPASAVLLTEHDVTIGAGSEVVVHPNGSSTPIASIDLGTPMCDDGINNDFVLDSDTDTADAQCVAGGGQTAAEDNAECLNGHQDWVQPHYTYESDDDIAYDYVFPTYYAVFAGATCIPVTITATDDLDGDATTSSYDQDVEMFASFDLGGGVECTLGPIAATLVSTSFDGTDGEIVATNVNLPPVLDDAPCNEDAADLINNFLGLGGMSPAQADVTLVVNFDPSIT